MERYFFNKRKADKECITGCENDSIEEAVDYLAKCVRRNVLLDGREAFKIEGMTSILKCPDEDGFMWTVFVQELDVIPDLENSEERN